MYNVFLFERIPSLNKGEEAILVGLVRSLKKIHREINITIYSDTPDDDKKKYSGLVNIIQYERLLYQNKKHLKLNKVIFILSHIVFSLMYKIFKRLTFKLMNEIIWKTYIESDLILIGHDNMMGPPKFSPQYIGVILFDVMSYPHKYPHKTLLPSPISDLVI